MLIVTIKGIDWEINCLSSEDYVKKLLSLDKRCREDDGSLALCDKMNMKVFYRLPCNIYTIRHEIYHAFVGSCLITTTNDISPYDIEEIGAEIISYHLEDIHNISLTIYNHMKKKYNKEKKPKKEKKATKGRK